MGAVPRSAGRRGTDRQRCATVIACSCAVSSRIPRGVVIAGRAAAYGLCVSLDRHPRQRRRPPQRAPAAARRSPSSARWPRPGGRSSGRRTSRRRRPRRSSPTWPPTTRSVCRTCWRRPWRPGCCGGSAPVVTTVGIAAFALTVAPLVTPRIPNRRAYASLAAQWLVLALGTGSVAAWVRRVRLSATEPADTSAASYAAAYRLLSQLRVVSRQLSGGLDAYSLGQATLESLRAALPYSRGAVYARSEGGRLIPLAYSGVSRVDWVPRLDDDSVWAFAWTLRAPAAPAGDLLRRARRLRGRPAAARGRARGRAGRGRAARGPVPAGRAGDRRRGRRRGRAADRDGAALLRGAPDRDRGGTAPAGPRDPRRHRPGAGLAGLRHRRHVLPASPTTSSASPCSSCAAS